MANFQGYLLFHTLIELFTVVVAFGIFAIAWSSRHYISNYFLLIVGISYFFVGGLDLVHTLSYKGMGLVGENDPDLPTQLWIIARSFDAASFLLAFWFLGKKISKDRAKKYKKAYIIFFSYAVVSAALLILIFPFHVFPAAFVEGEGLTPFKKASEYVISLIFLAAAFVLYGKRKFMSREMGGLLFFALLFKIAAEISFTEYVSVYGFVNIIGHIFKFLSFLFVYKAVLEIGLLDPYRFLFLNLKRSEENYRKTLDNMMEGCQVIGFDWRYKYVNRAVLSQGKKTEKDLLGQTMMEAYPGVEKTEMFSQLKKCMEERCSAQIQNKFAFPDGSYGWFELSIQPSPEGLFVLSMDISKRKKAEEELIEAQSEIQRRAQSQLEESYKYLGTINRKISMLLEMERHSGGKVKKKEVSDYILDSAMNLAKAKAGFLYVFGKDENFELLSEKGLKKEKKFDAGCIECEKGQILSRIFSEKSRISGPCRDVEIGCFGKGEDFTYSITLPLVKEKNLFGLIFLGFSDRVSMEAAELEFFDVFAVHASRALGRTKNIFA